jgi:TolB-like protein
MRRPLVNGNGIVITDGPVQEQLRTTESHGLFAPSERMTRFLRFTVEETLRGNGADLKEYLIGTKVFDCGDVYDPRVDPIVRVEARRLRNYSGDGCNDPVTIEFAVGSYAPRIHQRDETQTKAVGPARSIAVLPFATLSNNAHDDLFSAGLTEELIHAFARVPEIRVVTQSSAFRLRVRVQLIDNDTGVYLESETFDRQTREFPGAQEELSKAIVHMVRERLDGEFVEMATLILQERDVL